jgi:hypothetical protein
MKIANHSDGQDLHVTVRQWVTNGQTNPCIPPATVIYSIITRIVGVKATLKETTGQIKLDHPGSSKDDMDDFGCRIKPHRRRNIVTCPRG